MQRCTNIYQKWYVIKSSFPAYYYIANSPVSNPFMKVIAAGDDIEDLLYPILYTSSFDLLSARYHHK